jgi:hypothetical protein
MTLSFNEWNSSVIDCGNFTYTALSNDSTLPSFIGFNSANMSFEIYSTTVSDADTYNISVTGITPLGANSTIFFILNVTNPCLTANITAKAISNQIYYIYDTPLNITLGYSSNASSTLCGDFVFNITNSSG